MKSTHLKELRKKEVRALRKRQRAIWKEIVALGYRELKEPIRNGWYKELVITENVERYRNKEAILELYEVIQKSYWGRTKEKAEKQWYNQVSKYLIYKDLPTISKKQFNQLSYKAQKLCTVYRFRNANRKFVTRFYVRIPRNAFRIRYSKAYVTHSKIINPLLTSEDDLIENKLLRPEYYKYSCYKWRKDWPVAPVKKERKEKRIALKALNKYAIEDIIKEQITWEQN